MDAVDFSILIAVVVSILFIVAGYFLHHRDIVNPISAFVVMELVIMGLLSAASSWYAFNVFDITESRLSAAVWVHLIYGFSVVTGYFFKPIYAPLLFLVKSCSSKTISIRSKSLVRMALILGIIFSMLMLVLSGPEGLLWLTNSRDAYIRLRAGSGQWWVLYQICVVLLFVKTLFEGAKKGNSKFRIFKIVIFYCGLMYLTGSKSAVLIIPIFTILYFHFNNRVLSSSRLLAFFSLMIMGFVFLVSEGNTINLVNVLRYFSDYVAVTALNIEQIDAQGFVFGEASFSSLWYWVPRSLIIDKPYEWGTTYLNGILFPGSAEQGHTPGVLLWITYYIDFGLIGVILYGVFLGSFSRAVYLNFIKRRDSGSFLLMIPFCFYIVPVSAGSSSLFMLMAIFLWLFDGRKSGKVFRPDSVCLQDKHNQPYSYI